MNVELGVDETGAVLRRRSTGSTEPGLNECTLRAVAQDIRAAGGEAASNSDSVTDYAAVCRMVRPWSSPSGP